MAFNLHNYLDYVLLSFDIESLKVFIIFKQLPILFVFYHNGALQSDLKHDLEVELIEEFEKDLEVLNKQAFSL